MFVQVPYSFFDHPRLTNHTEINRPSDAIHRVFRLHLLHHMGHDHALRRPGTFLLTTESYVNHCWRPLGTPSSWSLSCTRMGNQNPGDSPSDRWHFGRIIPRIRHGQVCSEKGCKEQKQVILSWIYDHGAHQRSECLMYIKGLRRNNMFTGLLLIQPNWVALRKINYYSRMPAIPSPHNRSRLIASRVRHLCLLLRSPLCTRNTHVSQ